MMRKVSMLTAAIFLFSAAPGFSQMTQAEKDECLLASRNCMNQVDDIQKRIKKLDKEIQKGTRVYTPEELKKLQDKLTETQQVLKDLEKPGH